MFGTPYVKLPLARGGSSSRPMFARPFRYGPVRQKTNLSGKSVKQPD